MLQATLLEVAEPPPSTERRCRRCGGADHNARKCEGVPLPGYDEIRARDYRAEEERRARKHPVRPKSLGSAMRVSHEEAVHLKLLNDFEDFPYDRPRTRGDCAAVERPCPFVSCTHNLFLQVSAKTGNIRLNFPDIDPTEMAADRSCDLDVAEDGGASLEHVGLLLNVTRERVRQIEDRGLERLRATGQAETLKDFIGHRMSVGVSPIADAMTQSTRGDNEPDDEGAELREHIPTLPHIGDATVSDAQYCNAITERWDRWREDREAEARGELKKVGGRYVSARQLKALNAIRDSWKTRGHSPSITEIADAAGVDGDNVSARRQNTTMLLRHLRDIGLVTGKRAALQVVDLPAEATPEPAPAVEPQASAVAESQAVTDSEPPPSESDG